MRQVLIGFAMTLSASAAAAQEEAPDFTSPEATVRTMMHAVVEQDAALLAACFSQRAPREFAPVLERRLTAEDWEEWQELFAGARIDGHQELEDGVHAIVMVQLTSRLERLSVVREDGAWRIMDF